MHVESRITALGFESCNSNRSVFIHTKHNLILSVYQLQSDPSETHANQLRNSYDSYNTPKIPVLDIVHLKPLHILHKQSQVTAIHPPMTILTHPVQPLAKDSCTTVALSPISGKTAHRRVINHGIRVHLNFRCYW
jgi:hypothetical protein